MAVQMEYVTGGENSLTNPLWQEGANLLKEAAGTQRAKGTWLKIELE